jgi:hypothetical protein
VDVASHSRRESSAAVACFFVATSYKYLSIRKWCKGASTR